MKKLFKNKEKAEKELRCKKCNRELASSNDTGSCERCKNTLARKTLKGIKFAGSIVLAIGAIAFGSATKK